MQDDQSWGSRQSPIKSFAFKARLAFVMIVGVGGLALSPVGAKAVGTVANVITSCSSSSACIGGKNSGSGFGVSGSAKNSSGVSGTTAVVQNGDFSIAGVLGTNTARSFGGIGVLGQGTYGVYGEGTFYSVYGYLSSSNKTGYGVVANDASYAGGYGLAAHSNNGVAANLQQSLGNTDDNLQLIGGQYYGGAPPQTLINAETNDDVSVMTLDDAGNIDIKGKLSTDGSCKNGCEKSRVRSYAPRESVPTMEDVGEAKLVAGSAQVALDPAFANVIDTNTGYDVLITPKGDSNGLYVAQTTSQGFVVRENRGGRSSLVFSYRIVAKPYGTTDPRLPMMAYTARRSSQLPPIGNPTH